MLSLESLFGEEAAVLREGDFQLLLLVGILAPFGNGLLSPILDSLIDPLGASVGTIGLMVSVFLAPGIVVIPVVGVFADRYGRKSILVPSLVLFGVSGAMIAFTTELWVALLLRLLQGVGWGGLFTLIVTSLGDLYTGPKEATAQGLNLTGSGLGGGAASVIAGSLVVVAWQFPFLLYLLALPVAAAMYAWFDEPTSAEEEETAPDGRGSEYAWELVGLMRQRRVLVILLARTLPMVIFIGFLTYNSVIVVRLLGGTPEQAGVLYAGMSVVYAVAASQVGRVTAAVGGRYRALIGANVCLLGGLAVVFLAPGLLVVGAGVMAVGVGFGIALPAYNTLLTGFAPERLRAGLVSLSSTGVRVMGVVTPVVMGGAIALLTPVVGFASAVQFAGLGAALVGGGGGIVGVLAALAAPPVEDWHTGQTT